MRGVMPPMVPTATPSVGQVPMFQVAFPLVKEVRSSFSHLKTGTEQSNSYAAGNGSGNDGKQLTTSVDV